MSTSESAWLAAERAALEARAQLLEQTRAGLIDLLTAARDDIVAILAAAPTDYQLWHLSQLQRDIDRVIADLATASTRSVSDAVGTAWAGGQASIDDPVAAAGIRLEHALVRINIDQLNAMRAFMVDRITDVTVQAAATISRELGLTMIGAQTVHETIQAVKAAMTGISDSRATTIVRTELSRVWAVAAAARAAQVDEAGVAMEKVWRRSGKVHSRFTHDLADGQRVAVDEPFRVGGRKMLYPHDPKAPASETINCGCVALYRPKEWPSDLPDQRPFSQAEISANPYKADLEKLRQG